MIARLYGKTTLSFVRNFLTSDYTFCIPTSNKWVSVALYSHQLSVWQSFSFILTILLYVRRYLTVLTGISLMTNDVEHICNIFICLLYIFFGEVSVYIFSFLIGLFFLLLSFNCSLYILYISLLSIVWFQIFSPSWTNSSQRVCGDLVLLLNWIRGKIWGNSSLALLCSWENHSQQAN